jgi:hypothetical protein
MSGAVVDNGTVSLPGSGQQTTGTISLDPGYYQVLVSLTKDNEGAGFPEIIHIYTGLTSVLPAQTFTDTDFAALATVTDTVLTDAFAAPVGGATPDTTLNEDQYTGTISWDPMVSGTFGANTVYTATVTLTAKPGYTFTGVGANAFSYANTTSITNSADSGEVTIVFNATAAAPVNTGQASAAYAVDNGVIGVTAEPSNKTITQGGAVDLVLTVPQEYMVTGWYVDGTLVSALGTASSVTLDPDDYDAKTHRVSVFATKGGRPYSWSDTFMVEAAGGGGPTLLSLENFIAAAQNVTDNTPETAVTLALAPSVDLTDGLTLTSLDEGLDDLTDYIVVDLSAYTSLTAIPDGSWDSPGFNLAFAHPGCVSVILPPMITTIGSYAFTDTVDSGDGYIRYITIPAGVTSIGGQVFGSVITRVTFAGNLAAVGNSTFPAGEKFKTLYDAQSPKAGTYVRTGAAWSKEE